MQEIKRKLFTLANEHGMLWAKCLNALLVIDQYVDEENGPVLLYEDASTVANNSEDLVAYINIVQVSFNIWFSLTPYNNVFLYFSSVWVQR